MSNASRAWSSEAADNLKVFVPTSRDADSTDEFSPWVTVTQLFEHYVLPVCLIPSRSARKNIKQYRESVGYWAKFTGDPPLLQIDDFVLGKFLEGLSKLPGRKSDLLSNNTIRKHCTHVQAVINRAGPKTKRNKRGLALMQEVPLLDPPKLIVDDPLDGFSLDEFGRILKASKAATRPGLPGLKTEKYWRSKYTLIGNTGMRIGSAMLARFDRIDGEWISIEKKGGGIQRFFLNQASLDAIESIRSPSRRLIFPWPYWPTNESRMFNEHQAILAAANIPESRRFGFKGFRRYFLTIMAKENPMAAQLAAGHSGMATMQKHYVGRNLMANVMRNLPQPTWSASDTRQLELFS